MKITVKVIPNAKKNEVIKESDTVFKVKVNAPSREGRANIKLIEVLSKHFKVSRNSIIIKHGKASRNKIIEIGSESLHYDKR